MLEIKETELLRGLVMRREVTIPEIRSTAAELTSLVEADAARHGLQPVGPWVFIAHGLPRDSKTRFQLTLLRPVPAVSYGGELELVELEPVVVASATHQGPMRSLFTQGYAPLVRDIELSRHVFSGESREIYHQWAGQGARYNRIEIQFVLAR